MPRLPGKCCIVFSKTPELQRAVNQMEKALRKLGWQVTSKEAILARVPDLSPVDLMLFGIEEGVEPSESSYKELARSVQGVNFAGRKGALFSTGPSGIDALRRMLQASEIGLARTPLLVKSDTSEQSIENWLRLVTEG